MSIPGAANPLLLATAAAGGYQISRSLRFNSSDSAFCSRTFSSSGNRRTWTWAGWVKRSALGGDQVLFGACPNPGGADNDHYGLLISGDALWSSYYTGSQVFQCVTSAVLRDTAAWYHITVAFDTTQATASNRIKIYVNGSLQSLSTANYPSLNYDGQINSAIFHSIGKHPRVSLSYLSGYLADVFFIDGQALDPSSFVETSATTGRLEPKQYTGSFGTNGFRLDFSNPLDLGNDAAGTNDWTPNNLSGVSGGPTSVAAASGALPIYNTTDTYGATKGSGVRSDSNASSLVLAIPGGSSTGIDLSDQIPSGRTSSARTITSTGVTNSTAVSKYYGGSALFGTSGTKQVDITSTTDFDFGSGNFTIELWVYGTSWGSGTGTGGLFSKRNNSDVIGPWISSRINPNGSIFVLVADAAGTGWQLNTSSSATVSTQTWNHIAYCRSGSSFIVYLNGVSVINTSLSQSIAFDSYKLMLGNLGETGSNRCQLDGYIQDFRVYKGVAKYTSNFNPPSSTQNPTIAAGFDSTVDTPTSYGTDTGAGGEVRGNYCTWNPLNTTLPSVATAISVRNGNLDTITSRALVIGTIGVTSGKWYWEIAPQSNQVLLGVTTRALNINGPFPRYVGQDATSWGYWGSNGAVYNNAATLMTLSTFTAGDVIGIALDCDSGKLYFSKNGVWQNSANPSAGTNPISSALTAGPYFPVIGDGNDENVSNSASANFGQRQWAYAAPSGFRPIVDTLLPAPVVAKPSTVMDVALYTGNGSARSITGLGFSPDMVWIKSRSAIGNHRITDIVRGATKELSPDLTNAEGTDVNGVTSFDANGFSLGISSFQNGSGTTYAAWTWDAGSSTVTNTQGSITSQVRANASAGFSIVTYTGNGTLGATFGHGLGVKPGMVIVKNRTTASEDNWAVWHDSLGVGNWMYLNLTSAEQTGTSRFNATDPSSTLVTLGNSGDTNRDTHNYVCYAFAPVAGYTSMGSYVGNGSSDGVFVHTGFRVRWLMVKATSVGSWRIYDTSRSPYNVSTESLYANLSDSETTIYTGEYADLLSNGFKMRGNGSASNNNGTTYIYFAVAENPFQYARAR